MALFFDVLIIIHCSSTSHKSVAWSLLKPMLFQHCIKPRFAWPLLAKTNQHATIASPSMSTSKAASRCVQVVQFTHKHIPVAHKHIPPSSPQQRYNLGKCPHNNPRGEKVQICHNSSPSTFCCTCPADHPSTLRCLCFP